MTLTCQHVATEGILSAGGALQMEVTVDRDGYDLAAVFTEPLNVPAIEIGAAPLPGERLTITGYPMGRLASHSGRMTGRAAPESGQRWGDILVDVPSQGGDSGGPVTGERGKLKGILWGTRPSVSIITPVEAIVAFLDRLCVRHGARGGGIADLQEAPSFEPGPVRLPLVKVERDPPPAVSAEQLAQLIREGVSDVLAAREEQIQAEIADVEIPEWPIPPDHVDSLVKSAGAAVASGSQGPLPPSAAVGLLDAVVGTAAPSLLTALLPGLVAATGLGSLPAGAYVAFKVLPMLARWRRRRKTRAAVTGLAGVKGTQPPHEPPKARPVVPATTGESQAVTEESPSPEAVYNINYRPQPVDPGLLRMRRAFQRTSDEYPAAMPWVKRFEKIYELLLSGELK